MNEYRSLTKEKWVEIEVSGYSRSAFLDPWLTCIFPQLDNDDIFRWRVALVVLNPDSMYYGGYFKASMIFPKNYPYSPPSNSPHPSFALCRHHFADHDSPSR